MMLWPRHSSTSSANHRMLSSPQVSVVGGLFALPRYQYGCRFSDLILSAYLHLLWQTIVNYQTVDAFTPPVESGTYSPRPGPTTTVRLRKEPTAHRKSLSWSPTHAKQSESKDQWTLPLSTPPTTPRTLAGRRARPLLLVSLAETWKWIIVSDIGGN